MFFIFLTLWRKFGFALGDGFSTLDGLLVQNRRQASRVSVSAGIIAVELRKEIPERQVSDCPYSVSPQDRYTLWISRCSF